MQLRRLCLVHGGDADMEIINKLGRIMVRPSASQPVTEVHTPSLMASSDESVESSQSTAVARADYGHHIKGEI